MHSSTLILVLNLTIEIQHLKFESKTIKQTLIPLESNYLKIHNSL